MTLWYQFIGGSVNVTAHENSPLVHLCGWRMSNRYFAVLLLLYLYSVHISGDGLCNVGIVMYILF